MKTKAPKLIPPDRKQCQRNFLEGCWPSAEHFMAIGPGKLRRCTNKPVVIVTELLPAEDGLAGSMSLCPACFNFMADSLGTQHIEVKML